jgi:hypothetical protein
MKKKEPHEEGEKSVEEPEFLPLPVGIKIFPEEGPTTEKN